MFTAGQIVAHLVGDFVIQSHWMATNKSKRSFVTAIHAITYALPFLFLTRSVLASSLIALTHFVIDHWRLARFVIWARNSLAPVDSRVAWADCSHVTGQPKDVPIWLSMWLLIIVDNVMHLVCNALIIDSLSS